MRIRTHHIVWGGATIAVLLQLAIAIAFLVTATRTNRASDALSAHRVAVPGHLLDCAAVGGAGRAEQPTTLACRHRYGSEGQTFTMLIPKGVSTTVYVDPDDPSIRMSKVDFDGGRREIVGDLVIAAVLVIGAIAVTALHQMHRRRRRRLNSHAHADR